MGKSNFSNFSKEEIDLIFTQDWYDKVMDATTLVANNSKKLGINQDMAVQYVIDYNISKLLQEKVLNNLVDRLPKTLDWTNDKDIVEAFDEFKEIVDNCSVCPTFKKYKVRILTKGSKKLEELLFVLKELVNENYPELILKIIPLKYRNQFNLEVSLSK